jgi:glycine dehydrogenase subunit 2
LAPFLPRPVVVKDRKGYRLDYGGKKSAGKVREFFGNVPQVIKAYAWLLAMGRDGIEEASDLSVLANNYMDHRLAKIPGLSRSNPQIKKHRMEMTRWSLGKLKEDTGVGTIEVANRMADYGVDPYWMSHEPWVVPEPFTPEAGEMYSKEDLDYWIDVIAKICEEAYADAELVRSAPHKQPIGQIKSDWLDDPAKWAITWRAYLRKHGQSGESSLARPTHAAE